MKTYYKTWRQANFTLIEIIIVVSIIVVISGLTFSVIGRMPAGIVISNNAAQIDKILTSASARATLQGKLKNVVFDREKQKLFLTDKDDPDLLAPESGGKKTPKGSKDSFYIDKSIEVEFPDFAEGKVKYQFFPDGSASGPDMVIRLKEHNRLISVSPLTGITTIKEIEED